MIKGSCFCGQCGFEASGKLFDVLHCHCSNCRKLTGAAFSTYGGVSKNHFNWLCDPSEFREFESSECVTRYFCVACGTLIASIDKKEENTVYLCVGLLEPGTIIKPEYHQFVASKATWYEIKDDLMQFAGEITL